MRRPVEVLIAFMLLLVTSPIVATAACLIVAFDGGPAIHRRRVVGVHGKEFDAFKLRTMRVDADAWLDARPELLEDFQGRYKLDNDPRITPVGRTIRRWSIDELPQLLNVLSGQMSLVGPRMFHPSELGQYGKDAPEILSVPPGITGLWQVSGRQELDRASRIALDLAYVRDRSLRRDFVILMKTFPAVIGGQGAR